MYSLSQFRVLNSNQPIYHNLFTIFNSIVIDFYTLFHSSVSRNSVVDYALFKPGLI